MLNKELLMLVDQSPVHVTLRFYGGENTATFYYWTSPDGDDQRDEVFDERENVSVTITCKPNTEVMISTENYSGDYTATPPQDIRVVEGFITHLTFTAFRDVTVVF